MTLPFLAALITIGSFTWSFVFALVTGQIGADSWLLAVIEPLQNGLTAAFVATLLTASWTFHRANKIEAKRARAEPVLKIASEYVFSVRMEAWRLNETYGSESAKANIPGKLRLLLSQLDRAAVVCPNSYRSHASLVALRDAPPAADDATALLEALDEIEFFISDAKSEAFVVDRKT